MSEFWGYAGADLLAIFIIGSASLIFLICARRFVKNYGQ